MQLPWPARDKPAAMLRRPLEYTRKIVIKAYGCRLACLELVSRFSGGPPPSEIVDCVKLAERLGYESAWVAEGHGGDQFAVLAACATQTSRIGAGNQQ